MTTLYQRRTEHLFLFMFRKDFLIVKKRPKIALCSRNKVKLKQASTDESKLINSPLHRGIHLWNQLPSDVQHIDGLNTFTHNVRTMIDNGQTKCQ